MDRLSPRWLISLAALVRRPQPSGFRVYKRFKKRLACFASSCSRAETQTVGNGAEMAGAFFAPDVSLMGHCDLFVAVSTPATARRLSFAAVLVPKQLHREIFGFGFQALPKCYRTFTTSL